MDRRLWEQVREAYLDATGKPPDRQAQLLAAHPPEVRVEAERMLRADIEADGFLEPPSLRLPPGTELGAYRIDEFIAHGGMGEVYRGHREADFHKPVAIKVLAPVLALRDAHRLFTRERQMLAQLSHPNIVTLLDGGQSGGRPFLVMEWVEGQPMDRWAAGKSVHQRLELFEQVCSAVQAAHESLIVHQDLKPSNVLVTDTGQAKLLDFGIAQLVDLAADSPVARQTTLRALTLGYASPEQARGLPARIPSDIYSLGLLLFELVSEEAAQPVDRLPIDEAIRRISAEELPRTSAIDRELRAIAGKASAKDPARRYHSAAELREEIRRYRAGEPVSAQPPSLGYYARKYVARHRGAVGAAVIGLAATLVALDAFAFQFREAQQQHALAERRFAAARQMAQLLIFDTPQKLANVPNTLEYRTWAVERAAGYLDQLAKDIGGDEPLALSVARGYRQVAYQYFNTNTPNLNNPDKALEALLHGAAALESLPRAGPDVWVELISNRLARPYLPMQRYAESFANEDQALALQRRLAEARHPQAKDLQARIWFHQAGNVKRDPAYVLRLWTDLEAHYTAELAASPQDSVRMRNLALVHKNTATFLTARREFAAAAVQSAKALALDERRLALSPGDPSVIMDLSFDHGSIGLSLAYSGRPGEGVPHLRRAVEIRRELAARDAQDKRMQDRLAWSIGNLARTLADHGAPAEAKTLFREAIALRAAIGSPGSGDNSALDMHLRMARLLERQGRDTEACSHWRAAAKALPAAAEPPAPNVDPGLIRARVAACRP